MDKKLPNIYGIYIMDSHLKALIPILDFFKNKGHNIVIIKIDIVSGIEQTLVQLEDNGIVISAIGGKYLNYLIDYSYQKLFFVALFPGIVSDRCPEHFITKSKANIILLNSKKDVDYYKKICRSMKIANNGLLYGASWHIKVDKNNDSENFLLFVEQHDIPQAYLDKHKLIILLNNICSKSNIKCYIKLRCITLKTIENNIFYKIVHELGYQNIIKFPNEPIEFLLKNAYIIIGISSSAIIEGLLLGKKTYSLIDFYQKSYFNDYYDGSGIQISLKKFTSIENIINSNLNIDKYWYDMNVENIYENIEQIYEKILILFLDSNKPKHFLSFCFFRLCFNIGIKNICRIGFLSLWKKYKNSKRICNHTFNKMIKVSK